MEMCDLVIENSLNKHTQSTQKKCLEYLFATDIPHPCFVIDENSLLENVQILNNVQQKTGAKILLALKCFSAWSVFPLLSAAHNGHLHGVCASSVDEARLGHEEFGGEVHTFAAAWNEKEIRELIHTADCITFNSLNQWRKFRQIIFEANSNIRQNSPIHCGLRINPEHSESPVPMYDPCAPGSRLGMRLQDIEQMEENDFIGLSGLHFHTLCEQNADALMRTLYAFEKKFQKYFKYCKWFNFGGGHHITRKDYDLALLQSLLLDWKNRYGVQIYLEPGEAIALNAGWLTAEILDIVNADIPIAILDLSAACHMPDTLEMPYTPDVYYKTKNGEIKKAQESNTEQYIYRLGGKSCLAGDIIGEYSFDNPLQIGQKLIFADMAIYSMVKTNTFNGLRLPSIAVYGTHESRESNLTLKIIKKFAYEDFKGRLS